MTTTERQVTLRWIPSPKTEEENPRVGPTSYTFPCSIDKMNKEIGELMKGKLVEKAHDVDVTWVIRESVIGFIRGEPIYGGRFPTDLKWETCNVRNPSHLMVDAYEND